MTDDDLRAIEARHTAATSGPYYWRRFGQSLALVSRRGGAAIVMDFERRGMQGAEPRFSNRPPVGPDGEAHSGIMVRADRLTDAEGRGHVHGNPDARALAESWSDVDALLDALRRERATAARLRAWVREHGEHAAWCGDERGGPECDCGLDAALAEWPAR